MFYFWGNGMNAFFFHFIYYGGVGEGAVKSYKYLIKLRIETDVTPETANYNFQCPIGRDIVPLVKCSLVSKF